MMIYWKVLSELSELGETAVFLDPGLRRCFLAWTERHAGALARDASRELPRPGLAIELPVSLS